MLDTLEKKLFDYIRSNDLCEKDARVLLAVSGGADSVAMVHILRRLRSRGQLHCDFVIGHINHCLRGDQSDQDEVFVKTLADSLGIPVVAKKVDVKAYANTHKLSIETAGRMVRLRALAKMTRDNGCDRIATAHHADDLAETMVHRLMRGTGIRGLCGIWPISEVYGAKFIRPMLGVRRAEIIQFCKDNQIDWREDVSNKDIRFTRNRIRYHLLSRLESESGSIVEELAALSQTSRKFQVLTEKRAHAIVENGKFNMQNGTFCIQKEILKDTEPWVFYEVIREVLVTLGAGLRKYKQEHFEGIQKLIDNHASRLVLPSCVVAELSGNRLFVFKGKVEDASSDTEKSVRLGIGQSVTFRGRQIGCRLLQADDVDIDSFFRSKDANVEWFDADNIKGPIEIRGRGDGDRFCPIGGSGEKKVGRFLQDAQLDSEIRQNAFIIADAEKILWVAPVRMAERAKVTQNTRYILEICLE